MSRETLEQKAIRLLASRSVYVFEAARGRGRARVRGDHAEYELNFDSGRVDCPCPSWKACSHRRAVELVVSGADS